MGNLPTARTETCIAGAAVSHNLMNEIQDVLISTYGGPITIAGPITVTNGVIIPAGQILTVTDGSGFHYGQRTIEVPATAGVPFGSAMTWSVDNTGGPISYAAAALARWTIPIVLDVGARIIAVRGRILDSATGPTTVAMSVRKLASGTETLLGGAVTSAGTGAYQTLSVSGLNEIIIANTVYYASFTEPAGAATVKIQGIEVDYDRLS